MRGQAARLSADRTVKALILLGFSSLLCYLAISGQIRVYINPRFTMLSEMAAAALFLMFAVQLAPLRRRSHVHCDHGNAPRGWVYAVFIIPLSLALLLPNTFLDAGQAANRGLNLNNGNLKGAQAAPAPRGAAQPPGGAAGQAGPWNKENRDGAVPESGLIQVTDDNFVSVVTALNLFPDRYAGREIDMLGFVMRNKDFSAQEFGLVRFTITCCTADASPGGFICKYKDADNYEDGTWLEVRGAIGVDTYGGQLLPMIEVASVKRAAQPRDPYVYP